MEEESEVLNLDELQFINSLSGDTPEAKLSHAKQIVQTLQKQVFKLRAEAKRSQQTIKKLQDTATIQGHNVNNTSSSFMLPSQFKKTWEILIQENILDVFSIFLDSHTVFVYLVQQLFKLVLKRVNLDIEAKVQDVLRLLGVDHQQKQRVHKYLLKLFQDYSSNTFPVPSVQKIKQEYKAATYEEVPEDLKADYQETLDSDDFSEFVSIVYRLGLHMNLNDPLITVSFPEQLEYSVYQKPDDYYCIDGFPKNSPPCVIVLPTVMRGAHPYQGLKPAVLVISPQDLNKPVPKLNLEDTKQEPKISPSKEFSPRQVIDLYCRYKKKLKERESISSRVSRQDFPLQKRSIDFDPFPSDTARTRDIELPIPSAIRRKPGPVCPLCKPKLPCTKCSKTALLALAKRIPLSSFSNRHTTPMRAYSSSLFDTPGKSERNKTMTSLLTKKLSQAAKKMDRKAFIKDKVVDRDTCKVM